MRTRSGPLLGAPGGRAAEPVPISLQSAGGEASSRRRFRNFGGLIARFALTARVDLNEASIPSLWFDVFSVAVREIEAVSRGLRIAVRDPAEPLHRRLLLLSAASVRRAAGAPDEVRYQTDDGAMGFAPISACNPGVAPRLHATTDWQHRCRV